MSTAVATTTPKVSLIQKFATKYSVEPNKLLDTLKATAFQTDKEISNEQMMALLIVADQYNLNPFTKEIYAFPDKYKGIVPIVSVDGWARIINEHKEFDGVKFHLFKDEQGKVIEIECEIFRKDRAHSTSITEMLAECWRDTAAWKSHPSRMLRHKALIQCARYAFGFAGIYDEDEAQRIIEAQREPINVTPGASRSATAKEAARRAVGQAAAKHDGTPLDDATVVVSAVDEKQEVKDPPPPEDGNESVYTVESAIKLMGTAANRKGLDALWNMVLDDHVFRDIEVPPDIEDYYKRRRDELPDTPKGNKSK